MRFRIAETNRVVGLSDITAADAVEAVNYRKLSKANGHGSNEDYGLSAFDRAAFEGDALGENRLIRGYLEKIGVIDRAEKSLREIAQEL